MGIGGDADAIAKATERRIFVQGSSKISTECSSLQPTFVSLQPKCTIAESNPNDARSRYCRYGSS